MRTRLAAPVSLATVWQSSQIVLDPGSWEVKARFGNSLVVSAPAEGTIRFGIPTSVSAFTSLWTDLVTQAEVQGWQPTWLDRLQGPELTIITSATVTSVDQQIWEQWATTVQMRPRFMSVTDIQATFMSNLSTSFSTLKQKQLAVLNLHVGHQKTEVVLMAKAEVIAQTTFRWGLDTLAHATHDRRRWYCSRWGWELLQWVLLQYKMPSGTRYGMVLSGGGSQIDALSDLISIINPQAVMRVQEPELFLVNTQPQIVSTKS